ncbi:MAG: hypothetical protein HY647_05065 [Acidobacteria bacterium]|nr:hypothetical protein [Acidobacteriota bacterium]
MIEESANNPGPATEQQPEEKRRIPPAIVVALLLVAGLVVALFVFAPGQQDTSPTTPLKEAPTYAEQLELSDLQLSAAENFLGQQVVYLNGKMANQGSKTVGLVRVRLSFRDYLGQVILREEIELLGVRSQPLRSGEVRDFQLSFDRLPGSWNVQVPEIEFASIQVE